MLCRVRCVVIVAIRFCCSNSGSHCHVLAKYRLGFAEPVDIVLRSWKAVDNLKDVLSKVTWHYRMRVRPRQALGRWGENLF